MDDVIKKAINNLVVVEKDKDFKERNIRLYKDTSHKVERLPFYNVNRCDAFDLSPYDETILVDGDQSALIDQMQTREQLYEILDYHSYEKKLDLLFEKSNNK